MTLVGSLAFFQLAIENPQLLLAVYDRLHNMVYLDISQLAHFRFSLFAPRPARYV
jgi:hypothetical protein